MNLTDDYMFVIWLLAVCKIYLVCLSVSADLDETLKSS